MNNELVTLVEITAALTAANAAPYRATPSGCGRAYVVMTGSKGQVKTIEKACKALSLIFLKKAYGTSGNAIYIGYDNADGLALGKSEAFAAALNARGVPCYADAVAD